MSTETHNPYGYLEKNEFTSEIFKLEIKNLHSRIGFTQLKTRLKKLGINPHKMKILKNVTFVTFKCVEERDDAIKKISGHEWKGNILEAKVAAARCDPFIQKRKEDESQNGNDKMSNIDDNRTLEEKLKDHVIKFWRKSYEQQIEEKSTNVKSILIEFCKKLKKENIDFKNFLKLIQNEENNELPCCLEEIVQSPVQINYRNKCEFTIGMTMDGEGPIAGFCHGKYRGGIDAVGDATCVDILSPPMYQLLKFVNKLLPKFTTGELGVELQVFQPGLDTGHLRNLTVRTGSLVNGDSGDKKDYLLVIFDINPHNLSAEQLLKFEDVLKNCFINNDEFPIKITGLLMSVRKNNSDPLDLTTTKLLSGSSYIYESLFDLKFRISFNAFFQVNTLAANCLNSVIRKLLKERVLLNEQSKEVTLLDICCGTGTIGLAMSDLVSKVLGIEVVEESVEDAKFNAQLNNITNAEFIVGKAEVVLDNLLTAEQGNSESNNNKEFVAIVDPPRGGLHKSVIHAIRKCHLIKKVIYVSCNPNAAQTNFISFCRAVSKRMPGEPFVPQHSIPVDLFPQTPHVELVMLFSR